MPITRTRSPVDTSTVSPSTTWVTVTTAPAGGGGGGGSVGGGGGGGACVVGGAGGCVVGAAVVVGACVVVVGRGSGSAVQCPLVQVTRRSYSLRICPSWHFSPRLTT